MGVPVVLVTGFLGAGKTTLVNHMLRHANGRRIAALVNDFGAINIDAELIAGAADGVVSLANGCICCTLEGDLLSTLAAVLRRDPGPDAIVIESSGVADPAGIVRSLMDPGVWRSAPLDTAVCVVDAARPDLEDDALFRAQVAAADVLALSKCDAATDVGGFRTRLRALKPAAVLVEAVHGAVPPEVLFSPNVFSPGPLLQDLPAPRRPGRIGPFADRFESLSWTADRPVSLPRFAATLDRLAPRLVRAKGVLAVAGRPEPLLLQLVGGRAALSPAGPAPEGAPVVRLVFIAELGHLPSDELRTALENCLAD